MQNQLTEAVVRAAEQRGPERVWNVGPEAVVTFGTGQGHPFDGLTVTHWSYDG
ncbi:hypothetical protein [Rhodococcus sp. LB1]|uniref:hypothetical protein n=1 Tax=Rhodococcus sp. LB1 TaxID=1807499 RepID=UPI000B0F0C58|nr:hypothetical protein [Rhodococcus sp. LB1]